MKQILIYFLILTSFAYSQQKMNILYHANYELKFKEYTNSEKHEVNTFVMLFNKKESYFKNATIYVKDSLIDSGKIKYNNTQDDININMKYSTDFPYTIYKLGSEVSFANELPYSGELRYNESVEFKWKISKETKKIKGFVCIKATTTKWGRNWIAYYSPNHPMPFGPYKFCGLPGLIFEVADDKNDYSFQLYKFKNRKENNVELHNYPKAKKVTKKQYAIARYNDAVHPMEGTVKEDPDMPKRILKRKIEKEKKYNPIELTD
jgi:GLPGLI family protein